MSSSVGWTRVDADGGRPDAVTRPPVRRAHRKRGLALAAVVSLGVVIAFMVVAQHKQGTRSYAGLSLHLPKGWQPVDRTFNTAALNPPLGYLTNQRPVPECSTDTSGQTSCHAPVTELTGDGGLITISEQPALGTGLAAKSKLAGQAATINQHRPTDCPAGATYQITAEIQHADKVFTIDACLAQRDGQSRRTVERLLAAATFG